ncbi:MAG: AAA family ATPase [Candidatus Cryptobacteroides sp.]
MKNVASFDSNGATLGDLKKVNLIFGSNGSGKTTISNYLQCAGKRAVSGDEIPEKYRDCSIGWRKEDLSSELVVYNRAFRESNIGATRIPGVFTVGNKAKENREKIDQLGTKITEKNEKIKELEEANAARHDSIAFGGALFLSHIGAIEESLKNEVKNIYKEALKGLDRKPEERLDKIVSIYEKIEKGETVLDEDNLNNHIAIAGTPDSNPIGTVSMPDLTPIASIESNLIWSKPIVGSGDIDFAGFINKMGLSDWVRLGVEALEKEPGKCPFCQQSIATVDLKHKFDEFFNESYKSDLQIVSSAIDAYADHLDGLADFLKSLADNQDYSTFKVKDDIDGLLSDIQVHEKNNLRLMNDKVKSPSNKIELASGEELYNRVEDCINIINARIEDWNKNLADKKVIKRNLVDDVWKHVIAKPDYYAAIGNYVKERRTTEEEINKANNKQLELQGELALLNEKLRDLNSQATDTSAAVERINKALEVAQVKGFRIEAYDDSDTYHLVRPDSSEEAANTLSEGEETLISFLYYLQLLDGSLTAEGVGKNVIAVIDDPISSLDNHYFSIVSREIQNRIYDVGEKNCTIKQLIILTHNIQFYKSLCRAPIAFLGHDSNKEKTLYHIIKDTYSQVTKIDKEDEIESEYNAIWRTFKNARNNIFSNPDDEERTKDSKYIINNTMRRIYESFFSITCGYRDNDIAKKFARQEDRDAVRNLIIWMNRGSHAVGLEDINDLPNNQEIRTQKHHAQAEIPVILQPFHRHPSFSRSSAISAAYPGSSLGVSKIMGSPFSAG